MLISEPNASATPATHHHNAHAALALARYVHDRREALQMSVELSARLAGLEISQWYALESGWVPSDDEQIWAIAETLEVCEPQISLLALIGRYSQANPV